MAEAVRVLRVIPYQSSRITLHLSPKDIMIPAFAQRGNYEETSSSSIAAAVITRIPVLASDRHLMAYTYISGPAQVRKSTATSDADAIAELRSHGARLRENDAVWRKYQEGVIRENAEVWLRILARCRGDVIKGR